MNETTVTSSSKKKLLKNRTHTNTDLQFPNILHLNDNSNFLTALPGGIGKDYRKTTRQLSFKQIQALDMISKMNF